MNQFLFILFGASSDLAKRKLIPALYQLFIAGKLDGCFILGVAHTEQNIDELLENSRSFIETFILDKWFTFKKIWKYQKASVGDLNDMEQLAQTIQSIEKTYNLLC